MNIPFNLKLALTALLLAPALAACNGSGADGGNAAGGPPPAQVEVVTVQTQDVSLKTELPGRAVAFRKAEVRPQVTGIVVRRFFEEGAQVEEGEQLYQIDASRYEAAVLTAKANLERARANQNANKNRYDRYQDLLKQKAVSQQNYDDAEVAYKQSVAEMAVAQANLKTAEIDLNYTRVYAPISGRIGKSTVTEGALVAAQQAAVLTTIYQLDPIYVDLAQPARQVLDIRQQIASGTLAQKGAAPVKITLENGIEYEHTGELQFSEMSVNESTGTVVVRAKFPNPDATLLPGMFVRAEIQEGTRTQALLVPQRAVARDRTGSAQVMVVNAENKIEPRTVQTSRAVGGNWLVEGGLNAGERVVVEGLQKIQPGAVVNPVEQGAVAASAGGN